MIPDQDLTKLLIQANEGDSLALNKVFKLTHQELMQLAKKHRRLWKGNWTLDSVALLNEAYIKLYGQQTKAYKDHSHFFKIASKAMRQILHNYAEKSLAQKRKGDRVDLDEQWLKSETAEEFLILNEALDLLESSEPKLYEVFEQRFYNGLSIQETAEVLGIGHATVSRRYSQAIRIIYDFFQQ